MQVGAHHGIDLLAGQGAITYIDTTDESEDVQRNVYALPPRQVASGIATLVPASTSCV